MYKILGNILFSILVVLVFYVILGLNDCVFNVLYITPDSYSYIEASNMFFDKFKPHPTRPFGYSFILGLINLVYENPSRDQYIAYSILINLVSWVGSIVLLKKTLSIYFTDKVSFWLTLFSTLSIGNIAIVFQLLSESITVFFLSLISYFIIKYNKSKEFKYLIFAVTGMNLTILVRPGFLYLGIISSLILITILMYKRQVKNKEMSFFILSITLIAFQYTMMYKEYGKGTVSFIDKITWYYYLGAESQASKFETTYRSVRESRYLEHSKKSYKELSEISNKDLIDQIKNNFPNVIREWMRNLKQNSYVGAYGIKKAKKVHKINSNETYLFTSNLLYKISTMQNKFYILLFLLSLLMVVMNLFKTNVAIYILTTIISYVILTSGISFSQGDRFHCILYPLILILFLNLIKNKSYAKQWIKLQ